jgi:hypothetical protein
VEFLDLLEINRDRVPSRSKQAVRYIERQWLEAGQPSEGEALEEFLDRALEFCSSVELHYPSVLLLRLKQLQRGEWWPRMAQR